MTVNLRDEKGQFVKNLAVIDGVEHKCCFGPGHDEPTWLPATDKYFYLHKTGERAGMLSSRCRLCSNWNRLKSPGLSGTVPVQVVRPYFIEGVNRVGMEEFCRRTGINPSTVHYIVNDEPKGAKHWSGVQKRIVRKCLLELISMRRKGEVRHRKSIRRGTTVRGEPERKVEGWRDYRAPMSDSAKVSDAQRQRDKRASLTEEEREEIRRKDRERKHLRSTSKVR